MSLAQKTALILTPALTDGTFSFIAWKTFDGDNSSLQSAARLALHGAKNSWAHSLRVALNDKNDTSLPKPVLLHDNRLVGATYHHGTDHAHYVIGPLSSVQRVCTLTENEREVTTHYARQQAALGYVCYGVAGGHNKSDVTNVTQFEGPQRINFLGIVVVKPNLYPNVLQRLLVVSKKYSSIHYVATGNEYYASAIAVQSHLMSASGEVLRSTSLLAHEKSAMLLLPKREYDTYLKDGSYDQLFDTPLL
jgi:hypothetical protein